MSVIDKYPFINAVLTSLSDEDLASLQECVNGAGGSSVFKSILAGSPHLLKTTDKGVYPIELEVAPSGTAQTVYPGFLIYNDDYCVLISFATERSQILTVLNLTRVNDLWKSEIKPFELSITDLRSELFDVAGGSGGGSGGGEGSAFEKIELDLYFNDFDLTGEVPKLINQDKINQFKHIEEKVLNGDLVATVLELPILDYIPSEDAAPDTFGGSFILYPTSILGTLVFGTQYINTPNGAGGSLEAKNYMFAFAENPQTGDFEMTSLGFPAPYLQALFEEMSSHPDTGFKLKCTISSDSGAGSGGGDSPVAGGSGKLYVFDFDLTAYDIDGNVVDFSFTGSGSATSLPFEVQVYESNFEKCKTTFNQLAQMAGATININTPQDFANAINLFMNETIATTTGVKVGYIVLYYLICLADKSVIKFPISTDGGATLDNFIMVESADILGNLFGWAISGDIRIGLNGVKTEDGNQYEYIDGLNVNNSCTLTEYGTSASGGTVEAEPIVSIKMTNLDVATTDAYAIGEQIAGVQLYCTKERWDNMVSMAKQLDSSLDITYANFGTIYANLPTQTQGFLIGYLMMDYYEGKVLPKQYLYLEPNIKTILDTKGCLTAKSSATNNIEVVTSQEYSDYASMQYSFPSGDRANVPYTTNDTVITVEEIEGPAIGSSGGSGSSEREFDTLEILGTMFGTSTYLRYIFLHKTIIGSTMTTAFNNLITTINTQAGISIPSYTGFESLTDIVDYLNLLDSNTYLQVKQMFYINWFAGLNFCAMSIFGRQGNGGTFPVSCMANFDQNGVDTVLCFTKINTLSGAIVLYNMLGDTNQDYHFNIWINNND